MAVNDSTMRQINVLVCDDHALLRLGIQRLLDGESDIRVVGEAVNADEAVERTRELQPDVVLLDIAMPGRSGLDVLPELLVAAPDTNVLILSMQDEPVYARRAFASGATGYLSKEAAGSELVQAVRDVAAGRRYVHPLLGARLAEDAVDDRRRRNAEPLTERERDVLLLLALGHTNQEIAGQLFLSVRTVETNRAHIMRKLQLSTRAEVVGYALATGALARQNPLAA